MSRDPIGRGAIDNEQRLREGNIKKSNKEIAPKGKGGPFTLGKVSEGELPDGAVTHLVSCSNRKTWR